MNVDNGSRSLASLIRRSRRASMSRPRYRTLARAGAAAAIAAAAMLAGCGPADAPSAAAGGDRAVFHRGNGAEPGTLDPHRSEDSAASEVLRDLYEGLVTENVDATPAPGVAERWEVSDDGLTYVFHLRDTARWSNGDPVVAADFVAGLRRTVDPATASTYAQILQPIENAEAVIAGRLPPDALGVTALGEDRLEIRLGAPTPYLLGLLTHPSSFPIHRPSLGEHGDRFARPGALVSNGAYRLDEWVVQSHIRLVRNEHYWDRQNVEIDEVYFYPIENNESELSRYRAGELDFTASLPNTRLDWVRRNLGEELHVEPYLSVYFYGFDMTEPPFDDARLRQALSLAVDRELLVREVTGAGEVAAYSFVPPGVAGATPSPYPWSGRDQSARNDEARRLYREAGYGPDNPLRTEIRYNTDDNHRRIAIAVAAMWRETLGVEASLLNEEWKVMLQTRNNPALWQIIRYGWVGDYNDPHTFLEIFESGHGQNFVGFSSPEYDGLLADAAIENDPAARSALLADAERVLLDEYPVIPLYFAVTKHLVKPHVQGYRPNIMNHNLTRHYRIVER